MKIEPLGGHRRIVIMGLGTFGGGAGAARFWSRLGAEVTVTDLRDASVLADSLASLEETSCRFVLGEHREEDFRRADLVVVNPAVRPDNPFVRLARAAGASIVTEVGLVFRIASGPVLAVTGSNGKSTTTSLLGTMLRAHDPRALVGGNLGGSLLPSLESHLPSAPIVLELSSFQLHYLREQQAAPTVAIVTNLSPNHLDWHPTLLSYYEDKRNILRFQQPGDVAVLNADDPVLRAWAEDCPGRVLLTSLNDPGGPAACFVRRDDGAPCLVIRWNGEETPLAPVSALRLPGQHNLQNALQAAAAAFVHTHCAASVRKGLEAFGGLPHRLEEVARADGIRFVNDSIATTPESTICALEAFDDPVVLIAGGYDKGVDFGALGAAVADRAAAVVLIGKTAPKIRDAIRAASEEARILEGGEDFEKAVRLAREACPPGGVVLLSPACASYGMFRDFRERGERFRELVVNGG